VAMRGWLCEIGILDLGRDVADGMNTWKLHTVIWIGLELLGR
jgi:hypothetical protein